MAFEKDLFHVQKDEVAAKELVGGKEEKNVPTVYIICGSPGNWKSTFTLSLMVNYLKEAKGEYGLYFTFEQRTKSLRSSFGEITEINLDKINNFKMIDIARGREERQTTIIRDAMEKINAIDEELAVLSDVFSRLVEGVKELPVEERKEIEPKVPDEFLQELRKEGIPPELLQQFTKGALVDVTEEQVDKLNRIVRDVFNKRLDKDRSRMEKIDGLIETANEGLKKLKADADGAKKAKDEVQYKMLSKLHEGLKVRIARAKELRKEREGLVKKAEDGLEEVEFNWPELIYGMISKFRGYGKNVTLIAVDSLAGLYTATGMFPAPNTRAVVHKIFDRLRELEVRALLVADIPKWENEPANLYDDEDFLADAVMGVGLNILKKEKQRYVRIKKHRFYDHSHDRYRLEIMKKYGVVIKGYLPPVA